MAVIIKDKDLPPTCAKCPFSSVITSQITEDYTSFYGCTLENNIPIPVEGYHSHRTVWCPLMRA